MCLAEVFAHLAFTFAYQWPKVWKNIYQAETIMFGVFSQGSELHRGDRTYSAKQMEQAGREKRRRKVCFFIQKLDVTTLRKEEQPHSFHDILEKVMFHLRLRHRTDSLSWCFWKNNHWSVLTPSVLREEPVLCGALFNHLPILCFYSNQEWRENIRSCRSSG